MRACETTPGKEYMYQGRKVKRLECKCFKQLFLDGIRVICVQCNTEGFTPVEPSKTRYNQLVTGDLFGYQGFVYIKTPNASIKREDYEAFHLDQIVYFGDTDIQYFGRYRRKDVA